MAADGDSSDPQRLKKIAAASYDYDNDPRWAEYWSNIVVPPHLADVTRVQEHYKRKFYQRYIDPDLVVEPLSSTNSSQSQTPRASARSSSQPNTESVRPAGRQSQSGPGSGSAAPTGRNATGLQLDRRSIHFSVNAWVLVVSVLGMLPVVPRNLSSKGYRLSLIGTICSSIYSLYTLYGKPRTLTLADIQIWLQSIIATKDFIHFIYCLTLVTSKLHFKFALIPVFCWAIEHVARFLRRNFTRSSIYRKYLEEPCTWVEANGTTLSILSSHAEIGLGFLLIISMLSWQRNFIQVFIYWQLLKLMYHVPVTASYHQSVWAKIGRAVNPYIYQYAPFLKTPISMVQRWWFR